MTPTGAAQAWYAADEEGVALGVGWPVAPADLTGVEVLDLPAHDRAVTVIHRGSMTSVGETWQALAAEVERLGLQPSARAREVYHHVDEGDEDAWVTELQQPVD